MKKVSILTLAFFVVIVFSGNQVAAQACDDWWVDSTAKDIAKVQADLDTFTADRGWLVGRYTYDHLFMAVSTTERDYFYTDSKAPYKNCPALVAAYKKLSDTAAKTLPLFLADKRGYSNQSPANTKLMHSQIANIDQYKVHHTGVLEPNWLIAKNEYGIPTSRYKHGLVWFRNPKSTHPYCWIYYINIIQDYAGGGTYGASYASYVKGTLSGCPTS
jgi:hypothetical protein